MVVFSNLVDWIGYARLLREVAGQVRPHRRKRRGGLPPAPKVRERPDAEINDQFNDQFNGPV